MYTCITRNKKKIIKRKIKLILKANHFISLNEHDELVQSKSYIPCSMPQIHMKMKS